MNANKSIDVAVVGAGFAGIYMLLRARQAGLDARAYEAGGGVGGTWYWNRYPGARCDFESFDYSYEFDAELQRTWEWSERYPSQPELLRYLNHVVDRHELRPSIEVNARVTAADYDEDEQSWHLTIDAGGQTRSIQARYVVLATGALSAPRFPELPGLERFEGEIHHTANWPREQVSFRDKRVAVVGTGSSGAQIVPRIGEEASELFVLQRTPAYVVPARNRPLDARQRREFLRDVAGYRARARDAFLGVHFPSAGPSAAEAHPEERERVFEDRWTLGGSAILASYDDVLVDPRSNELIAAFLRTKIAETVHDEATARKLMPDYAVGGKRIVIESDYHATFNRPNVRLVDLREQPLRDITRTGLVTGDEHIDLDALVFATGFDALTGPPLAINPTGVGGLTLRQAWAAGPVSYLGLQVVGFPNLFFVAGPGSPSILSNVVRSIEQHVEWVDALIRHLEESGSATVEPSQEAQDYWVRHVNEVANMTLLPRVASWYLGANVPGKPRVFMPYAGGVPAYRAICEEIAADGYRGFRMSPKSEPAPSVTA